MKKLFLAVALIATTFTANAVDKDWNFSTWALQPLGYPAAYTIVDELMLCNPTVSPTFGVIDGSNKTIDAVAYTQRFKMGGAGGVVAPTYKPVQRTIAFNVAGNSTIKVGFVTGSTGASRSVLITDGTNLIATAAESLNTGISCNASYVGPAATIYIYGDASINIFDIQATNVTTASVTSPLASGINEAAASDVLSKVGDNLVNPSNLEVSVYTVLGAKVLTSSAASISVSGLANGVYVATTAEGTLKFIK